MYTVSWWVTKESRYMREYKKDKVGSSYELDCSWNNVFFRFMCHTINLQVFPICYLATMPWATKAWQIPFAFIVMWVLGIYLGHYSYVSFRDLSWTLQIVRPLQLLFIVCRTIDPTIKRALKVLVTWATLKVEYISIREIPESSTFYQYGLTLELYTHFTSPNRLYADNIVHQMFVVLCSNSTFYYRSKNKSNVVLRNLDII